MTSETAARPLVHLCAAIDALRAALDAFDPAVDDDRDAANRLAGPLWLLVAERERLERERGRQREG
jgi:hypothetical protein